MKNFFMRLQNLKYDILLKEREIAFIKENLKNIKAKKEHILNDIVLENNKIFEMLMYEEERKEKTKYNIFSYTLILFFMIILIIFFYYNIFTIKLFLMIIPIIISFIIRDKLIEKTKYKYTKFREKKQDLVDKEKEKRQGLLDCQRELTLKEESLSRLLKELEIDIKEKKEYLSAVETSIITLLAPTLDRIIEEEITKNNNIALQDALNRIREI